MNIIKYFFIGFLFLALTNCQNTTPQGSEETPAEAQEEQHQVLNLSDAQKASAGIEIGAPQKRKVSSYIECSGMVEVPPKGLISVYTPVKGFVQNVRHYSGDYVRKGQLLTSVKHPELIRMQREFLECQSRLVYLEKDFERQKELATQDAASQKTLEKASAEYHTEKARFDGLKAELNLIGLSAKTLAEKGEIQSVLNLYAPASGYLTQINVNPGKLVQPDELLYQIIDNRHVLIELQVFARDVGNVAKGQRIEVFLPGSTEAFGAKVHLVGKMIDPHSKTANVHGHFDQEPVKFVPGTYLKGRIHTTEREIWAVPEGAIVREGERCFVFVEKDGDFEKVEIEMGSVEDGFVEVVGMELRSDMQIVLDGAYYLR